MPLGRFTSGIMCYFRQLLAVTQFCPGGLPRSVRQLAARIAAEWVKENEDLTPAQGFSQEVRDGNSALAKIIPRHLYSPQGNPEKYGKNFAKPLKFN